jgi:ubiquinone/menaquinone biosynthesis C-methylase UbiE
LNLASLWRSFIRTFFRLLYHEMAWTYDLVAWLVSFGQWTAWGRAAIPHLRGRRVLELAHGPGHLLVAMSRAGFAPVGLDLSPQMGRLARKRLQTQGGIPIPPLVRARAQALPFRAGSFDSVVSTFPTEFIFEPATLKEMARVMGQGGRAVVVAGVVFNASLPARLLKRLYDATDQHEPPPLGLADALADAGLTLEREREQVGLVDVLIAVAKKQTRQPAVPKPDPGVASSHEPG